ncbi:hypothetical protein sync_0522 [Synechococcus sp. CC9311]|nr:hypothetical protein sync_0522 [Synechococcus sp. CC9311]
MGHIKPSTLKGNSSVKNLMQDWIGTETKQSDNSPPAQTLHTQSKSAYPHEKYQQLFL